MTTEVVERKGPGIFIILTLLFLFFSTASFAQTVNCENNCNLPECNFPANVEKGCRCFDGVDNDPIAGQPDRFDKKDPNCATYYGLTFVGEGSQCDINVPVVGSAFDLVGDPAESSNNTADTQSKIAVGDVDADGTPDVVITSKWNSEIRVVATSDGQADGSDAGEVKADYNLDGSKIFSGSGDCDPKNLLFEHEVLIANIDPNIDAKAEIFGVVSNRKGSPTSPPTCFFLVGFKYAAGGLVPMYNAIPIGPDRPGTFGIADMDGDGKAEIYMRDRIYAAETGALLATANGDWDLDITSGPVAVNISGDNKMELVCGTKIFSIPSLTNRNPASPAVLTLLHDMNTVSADKAYVKMMLDPAEYGEDTHSMCSVADLDNDGNMDVVISGALGSENGPTTVFYWNVIDNKVTKFIVPDPVYPNGWPWGTSRVNLGDANGDGIVDLIFNAGNQMFCLKADPATNLLTPLWAAPRIINDSRSGVLTVTLYDFNNDGLNEIVYRDSQELVIIDGLTGQTKIWSAICRSHTYTEGPVIADANGDGGTDICVACDFGKSFKIDDGIQQQALGVVRMFFSSGNEWLPTRQVWNQPGYFVVNINDDLTLPFPQFDMTTKFAGQCHPGQGTVSPMNVFLNQVPFMGADGCPFFPQPDLAFFGDAPGGVDTNGDGSVTPIVEVDPPYCGSPTVRVRFNIKNEGFLPITATVPVAFYKNDPLLGDAGSDLLFTTNISVNLPVGDTLRTAWISFNGSIDPFSLYIVLNNSGYPVVATATDCHLANNIYNVLVTPKLFTIAAVKVKDNITCDPNDKTGEAAVSSIKNGTTSITDWSKYTFKWYTGSNEIPGEIYYNMDELAAGTYAVTVTHKDVVTGCTSPPAQVVIGESSVLPKFKLTPKNQTTCTPLDGGVTADFLGVSTAGITLRWYDISNNLIAQGVDNLATLARGRYQLVASRGTCSYDSSVFIDGPLLPEGQAILVEPVTNCLNPSSGKITAKPFVYGSNPPALIPDADTTRYSFTWYKWDVATGTTGSVLAPGAAYTLPTRDVPTGEYLVTIMDNVTKCRSLNQMRIPVPDLTIVPTADIDIIANQTSCDPTKPNGEFLGTAMEFGSPAGNPSNYHYYWYLGQNTLAANQLKNPNGTVYDNPSLTSVKGGGQAYTLQVVSKDQDCSASTFSFVPDLPIIPVVTLDSINNTNCTSINPNGSVTAKVFKSGTEVADYTKFTYNWDAGSTLTGVNPVPNSTSKTLSQQKGGYYTLQVEDIANFCKSVAVNIEVLDRPDVPDLVFDIDPSTNCTTAPNGQAEITSIDGNGSFNVNNFTYKWFTSTDTIPANLVSAPNNQKLISGRKGLADFYALVRNKVNGCSTLRPVQIGDASVIPAISLLPKNNDICDETLSGQTFSGKVDATILNQGTTPLGEYKFDWFNKELGARSISGLATGLTWPAIDSGNYTLRVTHVPSGCISTVNSAVVNNVVTLPAIATSFLGSSNCDPSMPNGRVGVQAINGVAPNATLFTSAWYTGSTVSGTAVNAWTLKNLQGGPTSFHTVLITDKSNGCQSTRTQQVPDVREIPVITLSQTPNKKCETPFDGTASVATVTFKGAAYAAALTYQWFNGSGTTSPIATSNVQTLTGRENNLFFSAQATLDSIGCKSDYVAIEVLDGRVYPAITPTFAGSNNCPGGTPDGTASASATPPMGDTYQYFWYAGNTVGTAGTEVNANTADINIGGIQGSSSAYYTVMVKSATTKCFSNETVLIPDLSVLPIVAPLTPTNNPNCPLLPNGNPNTPGGQVVFNGLTENGVGVASPFTNYTFIWTGAKALTGANVTQLTQLGAGNYVLKIKNNLTNCTSDPVNADVLDALVYPVIVNDITPQTSCDLTSPTGVLEATVGGGTTGFDFDWFKGIGTGGPSVTEASEGLINQLITADYTIRAVNQVTKCASTESVFLPQNLTYPDLDWSNVLPLSRCDVPNGSATPVVTNGSANFTLFKVITLEGNTAPIDPAVVIGTGTTQNTLAPVTGLMPGYVTGVVRNNTTHCESSPETVEIGKNIADVSYQFDFASSASKCNQADPAWVGGGINVTVSGGVGPNFEYRWYRATPVNTKINFYNNPPDMGGSAVVNTDLTNEDLGRPNGTAPDNSPGFAAGVYTLVIKDLGNGCGAYEIESIPLATSPEIAVVETPNTQCLTPFNGSISVSLNNVVVGTGPFVTNIYKGNTVSGSPLHTGDVTAFLSGLEDGNYYVEMIDNTLEGGVLINAACPLGKGSIVIKQAYDPVVSLDVTAPNTACNLAPGEGKVEVTVIPNSNTPVGHTFNIYDITPAPAGFAAVNNVAANSPQVINGFGSTTYTVKVIDNMSKCEGEETIAIPDQPVVLSALSVTPTPETFCFPRSNGKITINGVTEDGVPGNINDYTYTWYEDGLMGTTLFGPNAAIVYDSTRTGWKTGATPGQGNGIHTYYVRGTKTTAPGAGCHTPLVSATVTDAHATPQTVLASIPNTSCTTTGEGAITVLAGTASSDPAIQNASYKYELYNPSPAKSVSQVDGSVLYTGFDKLTENGGTAYTVVATNGKSQCTVSNEMTVDVSTISITLTTAKVNQAICNPDGEVSVQSIFLGTPPAVSNPAEYTFQWFRAAASTPGTFDVTNPLKDSQAIPQIISGTVLSDGVAGNNAGEYESIGAGTYYVIATRNTNVALGAGCTSVPVRKDIIDVHVNPAFSLTPHKDTSCEGVGEGSIEVLKTSDDPAFPAANYSYFWTQTVPVSATNINDGDGDDSDGDSDHPKGMDNGSYEVRIVNNSTGCEVIASTTIIENKTPVIVTKAIAVDKLFCTPAQENITVTEVKVLDENGLPVIENPVDFEYTWERDGVGALAAKDLLLDRNNYADIGAGIYYVVAKRNQGAPGFGCVSAPYRVDIMDKTNLPNVSLTPTYNTACSLDPQFFEGTITIDASDPGGPGVGGTYTYSWTAADPANTSAVLTQNPKPTGDGVANVQGGLRDDLYTVSIKNNVTGCLTEAEMEITKSTIPVIIVDATPFPKVYCKPSGGALVNTITVGNGADANYNNFDFIWYEGDISNEIKNQSGLAQLDTLSYSTITQNSMTYFVKVKRKDTAVNPDNTPAIGRGCESLPVEITIPEATIDPELTLDATFNTHCNPALSNASVGALASKRAGDLTPGTYNYEWKLDGVSFANTTTSHSPAQDGLYLVKAINKRSLCSVEKEISVIRNLMLSQPNIVVVDPTEPIDCRPTGSAEVTQIMIGTATEDPQLPRFTYTWFKQDATTVIPNETTYLYDVVKEGKYFVSVYDNITECNSSEPVEVVIEKCVNCFVNVDITQTLKQINCKTANNDYSGQLEAIAVNHNAVTSVVDPVNYVFTWYNALDTVGTVYDNNDLSLLSNLKDGDYAVKVLDQGTNCRGMQYYIIQDDAMFFRPELVLTSAARQSCSVPDGGLLAQQSADVSESSGYPFWNALDYTVTLDGVVMNKTQNSPEIMSWFQSGLDTILTYTVRLVDNNTSCEVTQTIEIPANMHFPEIVIDEENPLQACDDALANGQLSATADGGQVGGYTFDWYAGEWSISNEPAPSTIPVNAPSGNNKLIGVGKAQSSDLWFTVKAINSLTGCYSYEKAQLSESLIFPITVKAELVQNDTRCDIDDGWVTGSVIDAQGTPQVAGYNFFWLNSAPSNTTSDGLEAIIQQEKAGAFPDGNNYQYFNNLPANMYYLIAEDIYSGCPAITNIEVKEVLEYPELVFRTTASFCEDVPSILSNGKGSGTIELSLEPSEIVSDDIKWFKEEPNSSYPDGSLSGNYIVELLPGWYAVEVTTNKGCLKEGRVEIPTDIMSYNLVTQNQDGKNDKFVIDCISRFPNNNVKIFNRSGVLVYNADYYDNQDTFFDGYGKNGIYMTGNLLPVGTYFYIIEKGDGSKPRTGYLELVR